MVVIEKRVERTMLMTGLLALIPEAIIAWIIATYTASGVVGFILAMLALLCLYVLIWIKNSLWMWLMYWVAGRRKISAGVEDYFIQNRFPRPAEYVTDIEDYLGQIANGQQHDCATRVKAAGDLGIFGGLKLGQRIQQSLQLKFAYEDALL